MRQTVLLIGFLVAACGAQSAAPHHDAAAASGAASVANGQLQEPAPRPLSVATLALWHAEASPDGRFLHVDAAQISRAFRRDEDSARRIVEGRRLIVKGTVRGVDERDGFIDVSLGDRSGRDVVLVTPANGDAEEADRARRSAVGHLLAVSCGEVVGDKDEVVLNDCTGFDG